MKRRKISLILIVMLLLTSIISSQTTISSKEETPILLNSPPEFLDRSVTSGNSKYTMDAPVAHIRRQFFDTTVTTITKFDVKLSRTGENENAFVCIDLVKYVDGQEVTVRTRYILANNIDESPSWYSCVFNDHESENENQQPYAIDLAASNFGIRVGLYSGGNNVQLHWHYDDSNPCEKGYAEIDENADFNYKTYGRNAIVFDVNNNGGSIILDGTTYQDEDSVYLPYGTFELRASINPGHEFVKWTHPAGAYGLFIDYEDANSAYTQVEIYGLGVITMDCLNIPPSTPTKPTGPQEAVIGEEVKFSTVSTDINDHWITYYWQINNDDDYKIRGPLPSGTTCYFKHTFWFEGTYNIRVFAADGYQGVSGWSETKTITITKPPNEPPSKPSKPSGPNEGLKNEEYTFSTKSSDPNLDQIRYGWDWDNDGNVDEWSGYKLTNIKCEMQHSWSQTGTYKIKVIAEDENGLQSQEWSDTKTITIEENSPPNKPSKPSGPANGVETASYKFASSSSDPDGHQIKYGWDWNNDGIVEEWSDLLDSGTICTKHHSWDNAGTYEFKVIVYDENDLASPWSETQTITIKENSPPNKPMKPSGPLEGKTGRSYEYHATTSDPDGHQLYYKFDWGDGTYSEWIGPYESDALAKTSKSWENDGSYNIKVKAKDEIGTESEWSESFSVVMPKSANQPIFKSILWKIITKYPIFQKIINL